MNRFFILMSLLLASTLSLSQQAIEVKSFEYIYERDHRAGANNTKQRIILLNDPMYQQRVKKSFKAAIEQKWKTSIQDFSISVKPINLFLTVPKFKPKVKMKEAGKAYAFIQVFDRCDYMNLPGQTNQSAYLTIRYQLISGGNDSVINDQSLNISIMRRACQPEQVLLGRLPGYQEDYIQAFDSIASWTMAEGNLGEKVLTINPACVFENKPSSIEPITTVSSFDVMPGRVETTAKKRKKNIAGNTIGGMFTLVTGIRTNKSKSTQLVSNHSFIAGSDTLHGFINHIETESAERERVREEEGYTNVSGEYALASRAVDTSAQNTITVNNQTLATFKIIFLYPETNHKQLWNGTDSSTVVPLPENWTNSSRTKEVEITGQMNGYAFRITTSNSTAVKRFMIGEEVAAEIIGFPKPVTAKIYKELSSQDLKIINILSLLVGSYYGYQ